MRLIIGLGNIGNDYAKTRHNTGYMALDAFAEAHSLQWQQKNRFKAQVAEGGAGPQKVLLAKPTTFYNLSGDAVQALRQFYNIDIGDILVVHDELALPFGSLRTRIGGSDAGNNGIKSIASAVGSDFARIRVGIANEHLANSDAAEFVLSQFTQQENEQLPGILHRATTLIAAFIEGTFTHTTTTN